MRDWLKKLRVEQNLSQQTVAEELNITQQHYSLIESGERQKDMSVSMAEKLANVFDVPLSYILDNEKTLNNVQ